MMTIGNIDLTKTLLLFDACILCMIPNQEPKYPLYHEETNMFRGKSYRRILTSKHKTHCKRLVKLNGFS